MNIIRAYTRHRDGVRYPSALAQSVHFQLERDGEIIPLNENCGILYPLADISADNTIIERGCKSPVIIKQDDGYDIAAVLCDAGGGQIDNLYVYWHTRDFVSFSEQSIKTAVPQGDNTAEISCDMADAVLSQWIPVHAVSVSTPDDIIIKSEDELDGICATVCYSDGSTHEKSVSWNRKSIKTEDEAGGIKSVSGYIKTNEYPFPLARGYGDPVIYKYGDAWYYIATSDNLGSIGLYLRKADSVRGLFETETEGVCILPYNKELDFVAAFWAPEFHIINNKLSILFAVSGSAWAPQSHIMTLCDGQDPMRAESWSTPKRICHRDGSVLCDHGITLDMTFIRAGGRSYYAWSERYGIGTAYDSGSMIYIGEIDEKEPERLLSEPVLLTRPLYGWENQSGTINNEGPYPLVYRGRVYLVYSGGAAGGFSYSLGCLTADENDDLLDINSWKKSMTPLLSTYLHGGVEGPGHHSFYTEDNGDIMIVYHAQAKYGADHRRCAGVHRVQIRANGELSLSLVPYRDMPQELRYVRLTYKTN